MSNPINLLSYSELVSEVNASILELDRLAAIIDSKNKQIVALWKALIAADETIAALREALDVMLRVTSGYAEIVNSGWYEQARAILDNTK